MNAALRKQAAGEDVAPILTEYARVLDHALARLPRSAGTVTRGIRFPSADDLARFVALKPGSVVSFNGYSSASYIEGAAFPGKIKLTIKARTARKVDHLAHNSQEKEALLGRGLQYRVTKRKLIKGVLHLDLEELTAAELRRLPREALFAEV